MATSFLNDPEHCRRRGREARRLATQLADPLSQQAMLDIADEYDRLAERAEEKAKNSQADLLKVGPKKLFDL